MERLNQRQGLIDHKFIKTDTYRISCITNLSRLPFAWLLVEIAGDLLRGKLATPC